MPQEPAKLEVFVHNFMHFLGSDFEKLDHFGGFFLSLLIHDAVLILGNCVEHDTGVSEETAALQTSDAELPTPYVDVGFLVLSDEVDCGRLFAHSNDALVLLEDIALEVAEEAPLHFDVRLVVECVVAKEKEVVVVVLLKNEVKDLVLELNA